MPMTDNGGDSEAGDGQSIAQATTVPPAVEKFVGADSMRDVFELMKLIELR